MIASAQSAASDLARLIRDAASEIDGIATTDLAAALAELSAAQARLSARMKAGAAAVRGAFAAATAEAEVITADLRADLCGSYVSEQYPHATCPPVVVAPAPPEKDAPEVCQTCKGSGRLADANGPFDCWTCRPAGDLPGPLAADCGPMTVPQMAAAADRMAQAVTEPMLSHLAANAPTKEGADEIAAAPFDPVDVPAPIEKYKKGGSKPKFRR